MSNLLEHSKNQILTNEFIDSLGVLSQPRRKKYRVTLGKVSRELGEFTDVDKKKLKDYIIKKNESPLSEHTKRDYKIVLKKFFGWLRDHEFVSWIKVGIVKATVGPDDILTADELDRLRYQCRTIRDKALIETLYESALRPHELLSLTKNNITFDDDITAIYIQKGKTGPRRVPVIHAGPLLANWIENHPLKDRDAPLWVDMSDNTMHKALKWEGLGRLIQRLAKRAGIEKRVTSYTFRHTRITDLANLNINEARLNEIAGWKQGSPMPSIYIHLSGNRVDDALRSAYSLMKPDTVQMKPPTQCPRCSTVSEASASTCRKCGMSLTFEEDMKKEDRFDRLEGMFVGILDHLTHDKGLSVELHREEGGDLLGYRITTKKADEKETRRAVRRVLQEREKEREDMESHT